MEPRDLKSRGSGGRPLTSPVVAIGTVDSGIGLDLIYLNNEYFGENPKFISVQNTGATSADFLAHEMGHNFGLTHKDGDYSQSGLMSNKHGVIRPTIENNVEIINKNAKNIKNKTD